MSTQRIIIDVREPDEYASGHIENAINVPPAVLLSGAPQLTHVDKDSGIIVYCRTGARSNASIQILKQMGFTNLVNGISAEHVRKKFVH